MIYLEIRDLRGSRQVQVGGNLILGRGDQTDVTLYGATVSRRHARILLYGQQVVLEDLDSTHGTTVNGQALQRWCVLHDGDQIQMGDVWALYRDAPDQSTPVEIPTPRHGVPIVLPSVRPVAASPGVSSTNPNMVACMHCGTLNLRTNSVCYHCGLALAAPVSAARQTGGRTPIQAPPLAASRGTGGAVPTWLMALLSTAVILLLCAIGVMIGILLANAPLSLWHPVTQWLAP